MTKTNQVILVFLSLLNKNPHRRLGLDTVACLLDCAVLWSPATPAGDHNGGGAGGGGGGPPGLETSNEAYAPTALPPDVRAVIDNDIRDGLLVNPVLDADNGAWWEVPQFDTPWWEHPTAVGPVLL